MCGTPIFIRRERSQMEPVFMHGGTGPKYVCVTLLRLLEK